ncbi:MAG: hypothetical protein KJP21_04325 [Bacteroidia bacterium]|nr:hypothetical protein [Bacteroidia bacterium]
MKKVLVIITITALFSACKKGENQLDLAKKLYAQAQENLDATTSKVALNQILMLDSTNLVYKDSLARLYMTTGNYKTGVKLGSEVYRNGTADNKLKETLALSYQQLGEIEKSEGLIDELMQATGNYKYMYQKLVLQFDKGDQAAFDTLATNLLTKIDSDSTIANTTISLPGPVTGVNQMVPLKAATLFIIGNNAFDREQNVQKAVEYFQKSIEEFNQFEMARYSLQEIERMIMASRR